MRYPFSKGEPVERVREFKYVQTITTDQLDSEVEIKRITYAKLAFYKMKHFLTSKSISLKTRQRITVLRVPILLLQGKIERKRGKGRKNYPR